MLNVLCCVCCVRMCGNVGLCLTVVVVVDKKRKPNDESICCCLSGGGEGADGRKVKV